MDTTLKDWAGEFMKDSNLRQFNCTGESTLMEFATEVGNCFQLTSRDIENLVVKGSDGMKIGAILETNRTDCVESRNLSTPAVCLIKIISVALASQHIICIRDGLYPIEYLDTFPDLSDVVMCEVADQTTVYLNPRGADTVSVAASVSGRPIVGSVSTCSAENVESYYRGDRRKKDEVVNSGIWDPLPGKLIKLIPAIPIPSSAESIRKTVGVALARFVDRINAIYTIYNDLVFWRYKRGQTSAEFRAYNPDEMMDTIKLLMNDVQLRAMMMTIPDTNMNKAIIGVHMMRLAMRSMPRISNFFASILQFKRDVEYNVSVEYSANLMYPHDESARSLCIIRLGMICSHIIMPSICKKYGVGHLVSRTIKRGYYVLAKSILFSYLFPDIYYGINSVFTTDYRTFQRHVQCRDRGVLSTIDRLVDMAISMGNVTDIKKIIDNTLSDIRLSPYVIPSNACVNEPLFDFITTRDSFIEHNIMA